MSRLGRWLLADTVSAGPRNVFELLLGLFAFVVLADDDPWSYNA